MKSINFLLMLSISIAQVVTASEPNANCEAGGSGSDLDHSNSDISMYYEENVQTCKSMEEDRPTCNQVHTERRHKFGLRYCDQLPEELKLTSLPVEWKGLSPWEIEAERRNILGVKKREKLPPHLSNLPSKVVYLAGQIMEDSETPLEDAIMQARVAFSYTRKSYKSSSSISEASKEKQKAKKSTSMQRAAKSTKPVITQATLLEEANAQFRDLTTYPSWYHTATSSANKESSEADKATN